ncbi:hypothetical protein PARPLA_02280 [Rhodobacteraceae bacterium THAF1]|uniref:hypothetical protein n=1 Tax=Palleronia sp. THAF1 TaxID=2587842 RepID=UPI000F3AF00D|nr:hypothetical protein [Palleronia sp. THAF1]QFU09314.1 hypothetical protein FIU81_11580 [Palleronia sp. THAF1]VDC26725.1 hypothetical protein PARPLA_02280 [Rhodobacteraceae bacterium THAF1]
MIGELRAEQVRVFAKKTVWVDTDADWPPPTRWEHREPMDALVEGSDTLPSYVRRALSGWDLSTAAPYGPARLSGTLAEIASLSYGTARARVLGLNRGRVEEAAPRPELSKAPSFRSGIRVDHCGLFLMPIWLSAYRWRGQVYHVAVHGQNGTVVGQRPLSRFRFWMMIAALVSACTFYYLMALTDII